MDQTPLVNEQIEAGAELAKAFSLYEPVSLAFWLREGDDEKWYFYIASDKIDDSNFDLAYGEILRILDSKSDLWLDPFQVKVLNIYKSPAKQLLQFARRFPGMLTTRIRGQMVDGIYIPEAVVYPANLQVKAAS